MVTVQPSPPLGRWCGWRVGWLWKLAPALERRGCGQNGELKTKCEGKSGLRQEAYTGGSPELWVFLLAEADFAWAGVNLVGKDWSGATCATG